MNKIKFQSLFKTDNSMRKDNLIIYFRSTLTSSLVILFSFTIFLTWISEPGFLKPKDVLAQECYQVCNQCDPQGCYCTIICPGFPPAPPPECRSGGCCELGVNCGDVPVPTDAAGNPITPGECRCEDNIECCAGYREYDGQETTLYLSVKDKESAVPNPYIEYKRSGNGQAANNVIVDVGDTIYFYPSPAFRRVATYNITLGNYGACGWPWWDAAKTSWSCPYSIVIGSAAFQGTVTAFQYNVVDYWWIPADGEVPVTVNINVRDCDKITCGAWSACGASGTQTRECDQLSPQGTQYKECYHDRFYEGRSCSNQCVAGDEVSCYGEPIIYSPDGLTWSSSFSPREYYPSYDPDLTYTGTWSGGEQWLYGWRVDPGCHGDHCPYPYPQTYIGYGMTTSTAGSSFTLPFRGNRVVIDTIAPIFIYIDVDTYCGGVRGPWCYNTNSGDFFVDGVKVLTKGFTGGGGDPWNRYRSTTTINTTEGEHTLRFVFNSGTWVSFLGFDVYSSCTPQGTCPSNPWWQAVDGDVQTNGDLQSNVPTGQNLIEDGPGGFPGVALYGGLTANTGNGSVSSQGWLTNSVYNGRMYDSQYFKNQIPSTTTMNSLPQTIGSSELAGGTPSGGYTWFSHDGDLVVGSDVTISGGQKTIVFVNGNLDINANITLANPGDDFLIFLTTGDITLTPTVTNLAGLYLTDDRFVSGAGDQQLRVVGAVTAWGGMILGREIEGSEASEIFEFSPGLIMAFPKSLMRERITWKEVAP